MKALIVGSGMSALGAALAASREDVLFDVIDIGENLPAPLSATKERLKRTPVALWPEAHHDSQANEQAPPGRPKFGVEKSILGSTFFLSNRFPCDDEGRAKRFAPSSDARGGMAAGWGASSLPIDRTTAEEWRRSGIDLTEAYQSILHILPYSFAADKLSEVFPSFSETPDTFEAAAGASTFIKRLESATQFEKFMVCGRARLLLDTSPSGCVGCGRCMSGCVFDAIFNPYRLLAKLVASSGGTLHSGFRIRSLTETDGGVRLLAEADHGSQEFGPYDLVLLATGPFSTWTILSESGVLNDSATVQARSGFQFVGFDIAAARAGQRPGLLGAKNAGPTNTLATAFIEIDRAFVGTPIHVQVSFRNELVAKAIRYVFRPRLLAGLARAFASRVRVFSVNFGMQKSGRYKISRGPSGSVAPSIRFFPARLGAANFGRLSAKLFKICIKARVIPVPFFRGNSGSYHVGSTLDNMGNPVFGTDGEVPGLGLTRVVDTSVLPELPSSTLALTSAANAFRIAGKVLGLAKARG